MVSIGGISGDHGSNWTVAQLDEYKPIRYKNNVSDIPVKAQTESGQENNKRTIEEIPKNSIDETTKINTLKNTKNCIRKNTQNKIELIRK